jgi:hypothetical protein
VNALLFEFAGQFGGRGVADGRVDRDDRSGLGVAASSPTTSRTCASSSTVMWMMSAAATSAMLSARLAPFSASGVIASVRMS